MAAPIDEATGSADRVRGIPWVHEWVCFRECMQAIWMSLDFAKTTYDITFFN